MCVCVHACMRACVCVCAYGVLYVYVLCVCVGGDTPESRKAKELSLS